MFVFHNDGTRIRETQRLERLMNKSSSDIDALLSPMLQDMWDAAPEDDRVSVGWVALPSLEIDIEPLVQGFISTFRSRKAYNRNFISDILLEKKLEQMAPLSTPNNDS